MLLQPHRKAITLRKQGYFDHYPHEWMAIKVASPGGSFNRLQRFSLGRGPLLLAASYVDCPPHVPTGQSLADFFEQPRSGV